MHVRESHRLRVSYNNSLRKLFNLPYDCSASGMCVSRGIPSYHEIVRKCTWNFLERLSNSDNVLLKSVVESSMTLGSSLWTHFYKILYGF